MTDEELVAIETRANAATPGPWTWETDYEEEGGYFLDGPEGEDIGWARSEPDIIFISATRTAVPALITEVRRLRDALGDAIELAEGGWLYAGDYFRNKWNFEAEVKALKEVLGE